MKHKHERISIANPIFNGNEKKYLNECIDTGWISANGKFIDEFQEKFANYCGTKYALACSNGTVTLHLALLALGIGPGDEVIMPTLTYIATANAVKYCGATPVFVDSNMSDWNISIDGIKKAITNRTKAIIPVHLYGLPCNMDSIIDLAMENNLYIIEDAAEAHGASWNNNKVGSLGDIGSFSFFGNKIITSGEGGMLVTNNKELYNKMKLLRSQGCDPTKRYWHTMVGYNYRMTNMQAAVGLAQLEKIDWHLNERQRIKDLYSKHLLELKDYISIQNVSKEANHVYWMYSILLNSNVKISRDFCMEKMEEYNIEMRPAFYPVHTMPPYLNNNIDTPNANFISTRGINLPTHALLKESDIEYIADCLKIIIKG